MKRKQKLIAALKTAVYALEKETVFYSWAEQSSCNCGVVAQAILGRNPQTLGADFTKSFTRLKKQYENSLVEERSWKQLTQISCSVTGVAMSGIIKELEEAGMHPEDITHLEYMSNHAIIKRAGIKKEPFMNDEMEDIEVPHPKFWPRLFGRKVKKKKRVQNKRSYYQSKENLIKYLKAWTSILEEKEIDTRPVGERLVNAVAEENYELAATLRDQMSKN